MWMKKFQLLALSLMMGIVQLKEFDSLAKIQAEPSEEDQQISAPVDNLIQKGASNKMIGGYWENWKDPIHPGAGCPDKTTCFLQDFKDTNMIFYGFLELRNFKTQPTQYWDGKAIYESYSHDDILNVLTNTTHSRYQNIQSLIAAAHQQGNKFIWTIGGATDIRLNVQDKDIPAFVDLCVKLLQLGGDGIDLDWEHISDNRDHRPEQTYLTAKVIYTMRSTFDSKGLKDKMIGLTLRFNAFVNDQNRPKGFVAFATDGEAVEIYNNLKNKFNVTMSSQIHWFNLMMYDINSNLLGHPGSLDLDVYKKVFNTTTQFLDPSVVVMGFEPGMQINWEGISVDESVIDYIQANGYGGIFFWAINAPQKSCGASSIILAEYAAQKFTSNENEFTPIF